MVSHGQLVLAGTLSESGSRLLSVLEAVGGFLAILLFVFFAAGRATGRLQRPLTILICLGPAVLLAAVGLVIPAVDTIVTSFKNQQYLGQKIDVKYVGFHNYAFDFTDPTTRATLIRTVLWLVIVPVAALLTGLIIALLADRMKHASVPKAMIFLPTAISFVGAAVIWQYVYNYVGPGNSQTGLLSAVVTHLGWKNPPNWLLTNPLNTFLIMVVLVWIEAGFAMVVLGAALKAIPDEILEAARMDGATGFRLFRTVQVPMIRSTLVVVLTTITIATLKLYDLVATMTNGNFNTDVLARVSYGDIFVTNQVGRGSSLMVLLLVAVIPLMAYNVVQLRKERAR